MVGVDQRRRLRGGVKDMDPLSTRLPPPSSDHGGGGMVWFAARRHLCAVDNDAEFFVGSVR